MSEIGEQILCSQLEPRTVVVLIGQHRPHAAITCWVAEVEPSGATFYLGETKTVLLLRANEKGELFDDQNHRILVHRYLGEV